MASARYLADANLCIDVLDGKSQKAMQRFSTCEIGEVVTSAIAFAEVMIGAEQRRKVERALAFFAQVPVLPFDEAAARTYSGLPFKRGSYDRLIAAHAITLGLPVVTSNLSDFAGIPGLQIENWAEA